MKTIWKTLILVVLTLSLVLALLSCTNKKENEPEADDDSWMKEDVSTDTGSYARAQQRFDDDDSDGAYQSKERVNLPTIPW